MQYGASAQQWFHSPGSSFSHRPAAVNSDLYETTGCLSSFDYQGNEEVGVEFKARRTKFACTFRRNGILQTDTDENHLHGCNVALVSNEWISGESQGGLKDGKKGEETHGEIQISD